MKLKQVELVVDQSPYVDNFMAILGALAAIGKLIICQARVVVVDNK